VSVAMPAMIALLASDAKRLFSEPSEIACPGQAAARS